MSDDEDQNLFWRGWDVPWHAHTLPLLVAAVMAIIWYSGAAGVDVATWQLTWGSVVRGEIAPLFLHMLAHAAAPHLVMNLIAMLLLSGALIATLGKPPTAWLRFSYLFAGSGICGALLFLALHSREGASLLGASGAIFGVLGALARVHPLTGTSLPIGSRRTWLLAKFFVNNHILLFTIVLVVALLTGQSTTFAWEAHLGGLLFGFFAAPLFLASQGDEQSEDKAAP